MHSLSRRTALLWISLLAFSSIAYSGDRKGNGGDIRRFRVSRALTNARWSVGMLRNLRETAACQDLNDPAFARIFPRVDQVSERLAFSNIQWSFAGDLPPAERPRECMRYAPPADAGAEGLYSFFYENCPRAYSRSYFLEQILRPIRDEVYPEFTSRELGAIFARLITNTELCAYRQIGVRQPSDAKNFIAIRPDAWRNPEAVGRFLADARSVIVEVLTSRMKSRKGGKYRLPPVVTIYGGLEKGFPRDRDFSYADILAELRKTRFEPNRTLDSCAQTDPHEGKTITFNPAVCGMITDTLDLAWILAHETAHHFGIRDESIADLFANEIVDMGSRK
jgi:hypothetical protein